jgi:hypothetical protein
MLMQGRAAVRVTLLLSLALLAGCAAPAPTEKPEETSLDEANRDFDASTTGAVHGTVLWQGDVPSIEPFRSPLNPLSPQVGSPRYLWPNPNVPVIDPETKGVEGAVVFLRGIDPRKAKPSPHPPVRVELRDHRLRVRQGDADAHTGFVRRGEAVTVVSEQEGFDSLQARGAAFFSLPFADARQPRTRTLDRSGLVELSSGAGHFWMRAYLFVDDHPYYARTDRRGRFTLSAVPPGDYELVCWLPDWREASRELDADTCLLCRLVFRPPLEWVRKVEVRAGADSEATFRASAK